jgi:hypothetical protein
MSKHYPRIRRYVDDNGRRILCKRESVGITFYMRRDHVEVAPAVLRALEVYRRAIVPHPLVEYLNHARDTWEPLDETGWAHIHKEMSEQTGTHLWLFGEESPTGYEFIYLGAQIEKPLDAQGQGEVCAASFLLPSEYLEEHGPERVRQLALELAQELPFNSGHAGLVFQGPLSPESIREEALQFPGLDLPDVQRTSWRIGTRVNGVHWMNFLGQPVLGVLGGGAGLCTQLHSPDTIVQALDNERAVVILGSWPEAGDLDQGHKLPAYRELVRVLEPWLHPSRRNIPGLSDEEMRRWQRRFLD